MARSLVNIGGQGGGASLTVKHPGAISPGGGMELTFEQRVQERLANVSPVTRFGVAGGTKLLRGGRAFVEGSRNALVGSIGTGERFAKLLGRGVTRVVLPKEQEESAIKQFGFTAPEQGQTGAEQILSQKAFPKELEFEPKGLIEKVLEFGGEALVGAPGPVGGLVVAGKAVPVAVTKYMVARAPRITKLLGLGGKSIAATTGQSLLSKAEAPSSTELGFGIALDLFFGAGGTLLLSKFFPNLAKATVVEPKSVKGLRKEGIQEPTITSIRGLQRNTQKFALKMLNQGEQAAKSNIPFRPTSLVGDELRDGYTELSNLVEEQGKKVGVLVKSDKNLFFPEGPLDEVGEDMADILGSKNVKISPGGKLDFHGSNFEDLKSDQKLIENLWGFLRPTTMEGMPDVIATRNMFDLISKIRNMYSLMYVKKKELSPDVKFLEAVVGKLRGVVDDVSPQIGDEMRKFADMVGLEGDIAQKLGASELRGESPLISAFGTSPREMREILERFDEMSKSLNMKSGRNLIQKTDIALAAEDLNNILARKTIAEQVRAGISASDVPVSRLGFVKEGIKILKKIDEGIFGDLTPSIKEMAEDIILLGQKGLPQEKEALIPFLTDLTKVVRAMLQEGGGEESMAGQEELQGQSQLQRPTRQTSEKTQTPEPPELDIP